jgi:hypothetical protein
MSRDRPGRRDRRGPYAVRDPADLVCGHRGSENGGRVNIVRSGRGTARPATRSRRRRKSLQLAAAAVIAALAVATGFLFVWPPSGAPAHVDAIVLLDGTGSRSPVAGRLAAEHRARYLVISTSTPLADGSSSCRPPVPGVRIICFNPSPSTTQGEAEYVSALARRHRWRSVALVSTAPQNLRARIRFERCTSARIYVVDAPLALASWPLEIVYNWLSTVKAVLVNRSC